MSTSKSVKTGSRPSDGDGLGSNPRENTDVCKRIVPLRQGGTLNSHRDASALVWLGEGEEKWEASDNPPECSPSKLGWDRERAKSYCHLYGGQSHG
ncbi:hypothetical protein TNCV_5059241 [Trichonephila clavipes]|nr:hypothetical protein TNCV_5059241 [Trichonephila clavipes]